MENLVNIDGIWKIESNHLPVHKLIKKPVSAYPFDTNPNPQKRKYLIVFAGFIQGETTISDKKAEHINAEIKPL